MSSNISTNENCSFIIQGSVKSIHKEFDELTRMLMAANFAVYFDASIFKCDTNRLFTQRDLDMIREGMFNEGDLRQSSFKEAKNDLDDTFSYGDDLRLIKDPQIINQRINYFWGMISKHISIPPHQVYQYQSYSRECRGAYWNSDYIFIYEGNGLLISIDATD